MKIDVKFNRSKQSFDMTFEQKIDMGDAVIVPKTITENGTYNAYKEGANGYNPVIVNVPTGVGLPEVTQADNGKFLRVVNGEWATAGMYYAETSNPAGGTTVTIG